MPSPADLSIYQLQLPASGHRLRIYAIPTGSVRIKVSHAGIGRGLLPILADWRWTKPRPVYTWLIDHPEGMILVDTGITTATLSEGYYDCDDKTGWVYRKILRFQVHSDLEIRPRLFQLGINPDGIKRIVLTHLHLDHVDGLVHFPDAEVLVSRTEFEKKNRVLSCRLPEGFRPTLIDYGEASLPGFPEAHCLTKAQDLWIVPTPGHTPGHQSVLLQTPQCDFLFAGDVVFSQWQLRRWIVPGINPSVVKSWKTYHAIKTYARQRRLVFLPSHDRLSGQRLAEMTYLPA